LLPYFWADFAFINVGTISTILFLAAAGYAVFEEHLFKLHVVIRATFVYGGLIALALELYNLVLGFLAKLLPLGDSTERDFAATGLVLVISAFSQQPFSRWMERQLRTIGRRFQHRRTSQMHHGTE
jgi:hypothetical protein